MFDSKGNRVKGFDYSGESRIITQPRHYRISNKDIIVFKTLDNLSILNRRGKIRIKPNENYDYSNEDIFQYKNLLVTTSDKNEIIGTNGNINHCSFSKKGGRIKIQSLTLDYLYSKGQIDNIAYIHLDVEGFEYNVIKGSEKIIKLF